MPRYSKDKYTELYNEYFKEAKKANERLRQLEKLAQQDKYKAVLDYAYRNAQADIKAMGVKGLRFPTAKPKNTRQLQARLNAVRRFTDAPTSYKSKINELYEKRAETFSRGAHTELSWEQMANVFEGGLWDTLRTKYGSKTAQRAIGKIKANKEELLKTIERGESIKFTGQYSRGLNELFAPDEAQNVDILTRFILAI